MKRLTTDTPQNNLESALNLFYAKDGEAWVRGGGPEPDYDDVTLFVYIRRAINALFIPGDQLDAVDNDTLSEIMFDWLQDGPESIPGVLAALYESAWAFAEIRARLKAYEDTGLAPDEIVRVVRRKDCKDRHSSEFCECRPEDGFCNDGERVESNGTE